MNGGLGRRRDGWHARHDGQIIGHKAANAFYAWQVRYALVTGCRPENCPYGCFSKKRMSTPDPILFG
jgi:hypothetical protein